MSNQRHPEMDLPATCFAKAREFVLRQARPLEQALYALHFENGSVEAVLRELVAYQNPDGGFGHGSEPDLRTPDSSAIATSHRLQLLRELSGCSRAAPPACSGDRQQTRQRGDRAPRLQQMLSGALDYLRTTLDQQNHVWPIIPPTTNNAPHAPWWTTKDLAKSWNGFRLNPTAELVGYFFVFGTPEDEPLRQSVLRGVLDYLESKQPDMHELLCCVRLAGMVELPAVAQEKIKQTVLATVERDPAKWPKYGLRPLTVVKSPSSPYYAGLRDSVEANLDYLIGEQGEDGAWSPTWSWGGAFPEAWEEAKRDWQGVLTLDALKVLRVFGRIANGND
jgi:hypothetical protein